MSERTCHKGPPPHIGWWHTQCDWWRWWDGKDWSYGVKSWVRPCTLARSVRVKVNAEFALGIRWSHYYPDNARVPRIDPGVTTS